MTPTDYAAEELSLWESALQDQRDAEALVSELRSKGRFGAVRELLPQLEFLRCRADVLLAEAVKVKCTFRDHSLTGVWVSSTQAQPLDGTPEGSS